MHFKSVTRIEEIVNSNTKEFRELFYRIYSIRSCVGELILPKKIEKWAREKFGNCEKQKIVRLTNKISGESTLFNELRAKRPFDAKSDFSIKVEDCAFCDPENRTPSDTFGRVIGKHCLTASNIAKYDCIHAVVVFKEHDPFVRSKEVIEDIFSVTQKWINKANKNNPTAKYPFFMWNCLWKAGASIVHGHAQILLSEEMYSKPLQFRRIRDEYKIKYSSDYLEDISYIHETLGLGKKYGNVKVLAYLTPIKEKEILMISDDFMSLADPLHKVLNAYYSMGVKSFNVAVYMPPIDEKDLYILRIVDRGNISNKTSDIGGMELYAGVSVVSSDPFVLARKLN